MFLSSIYVNLRHICKSKIPHLKLQHIKRINQNQSRTIHASLNYAANVSFRLSDIGEGIREVVIKEWYVKPGDEVSQFDEICEVQSDKATVTITSRYDGTIKKLHYEIDQTALVGKPLVDIETPDDNLQLNEEQDIPKQDDTPSPVIPLDIPAAKVDGPEILCVPSVRRLAKDYKVDLSQVRGTGKLGRILKEDVINFLEITSTQDVQRREHDQIGRDKIIPLTSFQKAMAKIMTASLNIPHLVYGDEITITKLSQLRKDINYIAEQRGMKFSLMPFFIKATSGALQHYPILNSNLDENCEHVIYKNEHNIGIAMDTKSGLAVPVIKNVQNLNITQINNELIRLLKSGRDGNFSMEDLSGGTFTLSNIGSIGGTYMKPVIMSPQVGLLALGSSRLLPRYDTSSNAIAQEIINISAAADHRIIDGATIARFVQLLKQQIENPVTLLLNI